MQTVGVLALQGGFAKHSAAFRALGVAVQEVRSSCDLEKCDALVIPGGESTTISRQLVFSGLDEAILHFSQTKPLWGTCAGLILMSKLGPLSTLDIEVQRNAYGRQAESFSATLDLKLGEQVYPFKAIFIRAPQIQLWNPEKVHLLANFEHRPVLVQQGRHLASTFHPELTDDLTLHRYFLSLLPS